MRKRDKRKFAKQQITVDGDSKIIKTPNGKWYACITRTTTKPELMPEQRGGSAVFLDPGVRTFQTFYSPDGVCGKVGNGYVESTLRDKHARIDKLVSLRATLDKTVHKRTRRNMRQRCTELRAKVRACVNDLHYKTAKLLTDAFDVVFMPPFETSNMVAKVDRNINSTTTRNMQCLSHYRFRKHLMHVCNTTNRTFVLVPEHYTTKTCSVCGALNDVGSSKVFACASCDCKGDRDLLAARNIGLKTVGLLTKTNTLMPPQCASRSMVQGRQDAERHEDSNDRSDVSSANSLSS
jgi:putative transposase